MTSSPIHALFGQLCRGLAVPTVDESPATARCHACGQRLVDGTPVQALVTQPPGDEACDYRVQQVACRDCPRTLCPTLGATAVAVRATLGVLQQAARQTHQLVLTEVAVTDWSPASEGGHEAALGRCRATRGREPSGGGA